MRARCTAGFPDSHFLAALHGPYCRQVDVVDPGHEQDEYPNQSQGIQLSWALRSAAFPEAQLKLYAKGLENTGKIMSGFDQGAEDILLVSEAVYSALIEATPQSRYLAGVSAQQMKGLASLPDQEKDQALLQMWEPVATQ